MTANAGNTRSRQARSHPDRLARYRGTVKKSRRQAASRLASDKDPIAEAKTSTPIAPHVTAFFGQRLPIERHASENTRLLCVCLQTALSLCQQTPPSDTLPTDGGANQ